MTTYRRAALCAVLCALAAPALAAEAPQPAAATAPAAPKRFSLAVKSERPQTTFTRIGKESGELVLADSSTARGAVTADWKDVTAEEAIADACKQINATWKRLYIPPGTAANADNVSQIYRNLRAILAGGLVALEPGSDRGTILLLNAPLPKEYRQVMDQPNTGFRRAYLILRERVALVPTELPTDDGQPWHPGEPLTPAKIARLQADTMSALSRMTPEERQASLQAATQSQMAIFSQNPQLLSQFIRETAGMQMQVLSQNPELMQGVMQTAMQAQIEAIQQMTPEQRRNMVRMQQEMIRQIPPEQMKQLTDLLRPGGQ